MDNDDEDADEVAEGGEREHLTSTIVSAEKSPSCAGALDRSAPETTPDFPSALPLLLPLPVPEAEPDPEDVPKAPEAATVAFEAPEAADRTR